MPHSLRKIRKTRGSRTQGYGRIGQHRDRGSSGYKKVGRHKHLWSYVTTYEPDYFNKSGFTSPQSLHRKNNAINLVNCRDYSCTGRLQKNCRPYQSWVHKTFRYGHNLSCLNRESSSLFQVCTGKSHCCRWKSNNTLPKRRVTD